MGARAVAPKAANGVPTLHLVPFGETDEASPPSDAVEGLEHRGGCPRKNGGALPHLGESPWHLPPRAIWHYAGGATFAVGDICPPRLKGSVHQDPVGKRGALRHRLRGWQRSV
jgi:hypothetical protein